MRATSRIFNRLATRPVAQRKGNNAPRRQFTQHQYEQPPMPGWPPGSEQKPAFIRFLPWIGLGIFAAVGGSLYFLAKDKNEKKRQAMQVKSVGTAKIGGPWTLVDQDGRPVTSANFYGKYTLVYFGFTYCPDICPYELRKMGQVVDEIDKTVGQIIQPMLVTVDPWRDTVEQMAVYVKDFHPRLIGLTGTPEQVDKISKDYRVFFTKTDPGQEEDYLVDHSIFMYLMDPEGKFVDYFGVNLDQKQIVEKIRNHLIETNKIPPDTLLNRVKSWFAQ